MDLSFVERYRPIIDDWDAFVDAIQRPLPTCIWTNTLRTSPDQVVEQLRNHGLSCEPLPWLPHAFKLPSDVRIGNQLAYGIGLYHVQEEASLLPIPLLDPQPGERIIDLCAAPGNKTAQIGVRMENRGTLVANDRNYGRLWTMRSTLDRLGLANVTTTCYDAANYPPESGHFDRVLVDVPCSCEGTSRKHPDVLEDATLSESLIGTQKAILRRAVQRCRPGGRIVYATCTYAPEENEAVVDHVLGTMGADQLSVRPARIDGVTSSPGLTEWKGDTFDPSLSRAMRVWPHQNDTGGFFVAVLEKSAAS